MLHNTHSQYLILYYKLPKSPVCQQATVSGLMFIALCLHSSTKSKLLFQLSRHVRDKIMNLSLEKDAFILKEATERARETKDDRCFLTTESLCNVDIKHHLLHFVSPAYLKTTKRDFIIRLMLLHIPLIPNIFSCFLV